MRANNAATAALTLALSGSLSLGLAGTAVAGTQNSPTAGAPLSAPRGTDSTVVQIRAIEGLGQLADLTATMGRASRDGDADSPVMRTVRQRVDSQLRRIERAVAQARTARTLPATGEEERRSTRVIRYTDASDAFRESVERMLERTRDSVDARTAASSALFRNLKAVNKAAMNEVGLRVEQTGSWRRSDSSSRSSASAGSSDPKAAVTTTLIDRDTLFYDGLGRYDDVTDEVGDLLEDVYESPGGRLSKEDADEHAEDIGEALDELRQRAGAGNAGTFAELEDRAEALLEASRTDSARQSRAKARLLVRETVKFLATMPTGGQVAGAGIENRVDDADDADDDERLWTGTLLSPMLFD